MSSSNGTLPVVIDDGWTQKGYIAKTPGIHGALRFDYRPATSLDSIQYGRVTDKLEGEKLYHAVAKWAAGRIVSWDAKGTVDAASLLRLADKLFQRLIRVLLGNEACDIDPELSEDDRAKEEADRKEAAERKLPLAVVREERDVKN